MIENLLLSAHVVAGILFIGPVAVTTSLFPRFVPLHADTSDVRRDVGVATMLHRVTRTYGLLAIAVPFVGLVLAAVQGRLGEIWITLALVLTAVAGGLLAARIAPLESEMLRDRATDSGLKALRGTVGVFNLLWVAVVVLMIVRPGADR